MPTNACNYSFADYLEKIPKTLKDVKSLFKTTDSKTDYIQGFMKAKRVSVCKLPLRVLFGICFQKISLKNMLRDSSFILTHVIAFLLAYSYLGI